MATNPPSEKMLTTLAAIQNGIITDPTDESLDKRTLRSLVNRKLVTGKKVLKVTKAGTKALDA